MFVGGLVNLAQPLAVKRLLDGVTGGTSFAEPMLLLAALLVAGALIGAGGMYLLEATAESVVLDARRRLIDRLLRLRVGVMDRAEPGDLLSRVTGDTTQLRAAATTNIVDLVTGVFQIGGAVVLMARLDLVLLGVVALVLALLLGVTALLAGRIRDVSERTQAAVGRLGAVLERALGAFRTVKANGAERQQTATAHRAATQAWQHGRRAARWVSAAGVTTGLAVQLAFVIVLGVGGARVAAGDLTVSSLVAFLLYLFYLAGPVSQLAGGVTGLQTGLAAVGRIDAVVRLPAEDPDEQAEPNAEATQPVSVAFHSVSLRHRPEDPDVLTDVTLRIPATGLTALVGPSGAGKSTLLALVERFQDPTSGHVEVGDRDIRRWPLRELRARIGYVEQDAPVLFGTLRDNLSRPRASPRRGRRRPGRWRGCPPWPTPRRCAAGGAAARWNAAKVVVSVGPYPLTSRAGGEPASNRRTTDRSSCSPPTRTVPTLRSAAGRSRAIRWNNEVVRNSTSTDRSSRCVVHSSRGRSVTAGRGTTQPPAASAPQTSKVLASNAGFEVWATRSPGATVQNSGSTTSRPTARCGTTTPFGSPVEPDVNMT